MNKLTWIQAIYDLPLRAVRTADERIAFVDDWIRDPNVGTHRCRFKIVAVEPVMKHFYRIRVHASLAAVKKITAVWSEGMYYTLNGKRRKT